MYFGGAHLLYGGEVLNNVELRVFGWYLLFHFAASLVFSELTSSYAAFLVGWLLSTFGKLAEKPKSKTQIRIFDFLRFVFFESIPES